MISVVELEDELNDEILEIIEFAKKKVDYGIFILAARNIFLKNLIVLPIRFELFLLICNIIHLTILLMKIK